MSDYSIKSVLISRDGLSPAEAADLITEAQLAIRQGEDPGEILSSWFGLEPDYIFALLEGYPK